MTQPLVPVVGHASLTECYERGVEGCVDGTGLCVIEESTCVPALERLPGMVLSTRDRVTAKAVISALLPGVGDENVNTEFAEGIQNLFGVLGHKISQRMLYLMTQPGGHASWQALASQVTQEITSRLREECPLCYTPLSERAQIQHPQNCCGRMFHRQCVSEWVVLRHRRGQEAKCPVNPNVTLAKDLQPVPTRALNDHVAYLAQRLEEYKGRTSRTTYTAAEREVLNHELDMVAEHKRRFDRRQAEILDLFYRQFMLPSFIRNKLKIDLFFQEIGAVRHEHLERLAELHGVAMARLVDENSPEGYAEQLGGIANHAVQTFTHDANANLKRKIMRFGISDIKAIIGFGLVYIFVLTVFELIGHEPGF